MRRLILNIALILLCLPALGVAGSFSGKALVNYTNYQAKEDGVLVAKGDGLSQRYQLLYADRGLWKKGKIGSYDYSIGYEWNMVDADQSKRSFDGNMVDDSTSIKTGKVLYRGDVLIAPGGLPFRLHLYSHDQQASIFETGRVLGRPAESENEPSRQLLIPEIIDDISNGQRYHTGGTLLVGIQNGRYQGQYRDLLSKLPRLLVDYKEIYVRDMKSLTPQHYRDRDLAFVSLNKKDNWFHYRFNDYVDFENDDSNRKERTYMLGTIDHNMVRHWVNLTNWIQVSADISFVQEMKSSAEKIRSIEEYQDADVTERTYLVNLFAKARKGKFEAVTLNSYERKSIYSDTETRIEVPLFINGSIDRDTSWRTTFIASRERRQFLISEEETNDQSAYLSMLVNAFKQSRYNLDVKLEGEINRDEIRSGEAVRATLEYLSNRHYQSALDFRLQSMTAYVQGENDDYDLKTDYFEQGFEFGAKWQATKRLKIDANQRLLFGFGDLSGRFTDRIIASGSQSLLESSGGLEQRTERVFRSTTSLYLDHVMGRLTNRLGGTFDYVEDELDSSYQYQLSHRLQFSGKSLHFNSTTLYTGGDEVESTTLANVVSVDQQTTGVVDWRLEHRSSVAYSPSPFLKFKARGNVLYQERDTGDSSLNLSFEEEARFNLMKYTGIKRTVASLIQEYEYLSMKEFDGTRKASNTFSLTLNYYPTTSSLLGVKLRYRNFHPYSDDELTCFLTAAQTFQRMKISLDYAYGQRDNGSLYPDRKEHRWEVNVEKTF